MTSFRTWHGYSRSKNELGLGFIKIAKTPSGPWQLVDEDKSTGDPNVEELYIDFKHKEIGLIFDFDYRQCEQANPSLRKRLGYVACSSNLSRSEAPNWMGLDEYALVEAAKQAGVFQRAPELLRELQAVQDKQRREAAAEELAWQEHLAAARRSEEEEREGAAKPFRDKLAVGNDTHCGMVIEIKKPIVKVQTSAGEKWLRLDQLFAPGQAPCRFVNGEYQTP